MLYPFKMKRVLNGLLRTNESNLNYELNDCVTRDTGFVLPPKAVRAGRMCLAAALMILFALAVPAQMLKTSTYSTSGHAFQALETPDGKYVLVTVDDVGVKSGPDISGIDIFHKTRGKLEHVAFQPMGKQDAQGIILIPHTRMLAVGMNDDGVAFLPLDDALQGNAKPTLLSQGDKAGSEFLAATSDGQYLFVSNESGDNGNIGVIALHPDAAGEVKPETLAHIHVPNAASDVSLSPDGTHVYAVGEVVSAPYAAAVPGHGVAELERSDCTQGPGSAMPNGVLYVIDVAKAIALTPASTPAETLAARTQVVDSGCSPVREIMTADGAMIYVTARGDNRVLVFDAKALDKDPAHAFRHAISTGGEAPIGMALFNNGKAILVSNSNRFVGGAGNATVINLSDPRKAVLKQTIETGAFPRDISTSVDGKTLYLCVYKARELMVLKR